MTTIVFDVPADSGGALSILNNFYDEYKMDKDNDYIFVVSTPKLEDASNLKVLRFPWIKTSWIHRVYFDYFKAPQLVKQYQADVVLSLQNVLIPGVKKNQVLYVHNSLPFVEKRFKLTENPRLWVYQNVIGPRIKKSIKKANRVIVQTNWMKRVCISTLRVKPDRIFVLKPEIVFDIKRKYTSTAENRRIFFYPASGHVYKNHKVIVDAALLLKKRRSTDFKIIFTLSGSENQNVISLYKQVKENDLPIEFIGTISQDIVFDYYTRSVLLFPSYIETFGMPLLEAKLHNTPIIASDCLFSHEILDGYKDVAYIDPFDRHRLARLLETFIVG